jgi:hypothetical protein
MCIIHVIGEEFFVNIILVKYDNDVVYISSIVWNFSILHPMSCIPKAMVGSERRVWEELTEREVLNASEHSRITPHVHSNTRRWVNNTLVY